MGYPLRWGLGGMAIATPVLLISVISSRFDYEFENIDKPIIVLVVLLMAAGAAYLWVVWRFEEGPPGRGLFGWVFLLGLSMRVAFLGSAPILEDDAYRYLWDGGVVAKGFSPYRYSPRDVLACQADTVPEELCRLGQEAPVVLKRINYPWLRTIYPPLAQAAFALAHVIRPWSLDAWRIVLLSMDVLTFYLLFTVLHRVHLSLRGMVIYWWNPLLVKEFYNSGHMDLLLLPLLLSCLLLVCRGRVVSASGTLGLAVGVKFWPAILLPLVLRPILSRPKMLLPALALFATISFAMFLPLYAGGLDSRSGFVAYSRFWEMNDALFMLVRWGVQGIKDLAGMDLASAQTLTRIAVAGILVLFVALLVRRDDHRPAVIGRRFLYIVAALYLLSPTQFPWYSLWMLPFLAIQPRFSLLVLTALLPLYYLRFHLSARGMVEVHDMGIVWLESVPIWCLLAWEWYKGRPKDVSGDEISAAAVST